MTVAPGFTAIGTIHVGGLRPGGKVAIHVWHSGGGTGVICPFVQDRAEAIEWVDTAPLILTEHDQPEWRTYQWTMPAATIHGVGIQLNNTGAGDLVVLLDAVTW